MKHFSFTVFYDKTELGEKSRDNVVATKKFTFDTEMDLCWEMKSLSSTKDKIEIGIFRLFNCFLRI